MQARDRWGNDLWTPDFNVSAELYIAVDSTVEDGADENGTAVSTAENDTVPVAVASSVTFLNNGSGIALVTYIPAESRPSFLQGD